MKGAQASFAEGELTCRGQQVEKINILFILNPFELLLVFTLPLSLTMKSTNQEQSVVTALPSPQEIRYQ